jgi:flagellar basal-body rod modification protein FlgD
MAISGSNAYASMDSNAFMKMFITQMTHQDPTSPMDAGQMLNQLTQLTTIEKMDSMSSSMDNLSSSFGDALRTENMNLATNLIDRTVAFDEGEGMQTGLVTGAAEHQDRVGVIIDGEFVGLNSVVEVGQQ